MTHQKRKIVICQYCGEVFHTNRGTRKFCSNAHRQRMYGESVMVKSQEKGHCRHQAQKRKPISRKVRRLEKLLTKLLEDFGDYSETPENTLRHQLWEDSAVELNESKKMMRYCIILGY